MKSNGRLGAAMLALCGLVTTMAGCSTMDMKGATQSVDDQRKAQEAQIPVCTHKLGSVAVNEPEASTNWWTGQQLPAPSKLIKVFVSKSGCFTLVDRGAGMDAAMRERALASGGELRSQSNLGKGQVKAADYVLVPDLVSANRDAGGSSIGGLVGGLIGGTAGAIASNVNFSTKTADVVLTLTDVRSSEQVAMTEGSAKKTDMGFGAGGALFGGSGLGAAGVGGYANTTVGQVITMAYLQAYTEMVTQLGGLSGNAAQSNAKQSVTVTTQGRMLASASGGKPVRDVTPGMTLYPTGNKQGAMWEVEDELGNKGWINSTQLELAK
jgi:curli biogenesis system outer membrane secretion channel CsgG